MKISHNLPIAVAAAAAIAAPTPANAAPTAKQTPKSPNIEIATAGLDFGQLESYEPSKAARGVARGLARKLVRHETVTIDRGDFSWGEGRDGQLTYKTSNPMLADVNGYPTHFTTNGAEFELNRRTHKLRLVNVNVEPIDERVAVITAPDIDIQDANIRLGLGHGLENESVKAPLMNENGGASIETVATTRQVEPY